MNHAADLIDRDLYWIMEQYEGWLDEDGQEKLSEHRICDRNRKAIAVAERATGDPWLLARDSERLKAAFCNQARYEDLNFVMVKTLVPRAPELSWGDVVQGRKKNA